MLSVHNLNLTTWYTDRELVYCPVHFVKTRTAITNESYNWILEKLHGRFSLVFYDDSNTLQYTSFNKVPAFESSKDAMLYELTWSN